MTDPRPTSAVVDGVDIDAVHAAISACPAVSRVGGPGVAALTTYLPGRRIPGVRVNSDSVDVEIVAVWDCPAATVAAQVRQAVAPLQSQAGG